MKIPISVRVFAMLAFIALLLSAAMPCSAQTISTGVYYLWLPFDPAITPTTTILADTGVFGWDASFSMKLSDQLAIDVIYARKPLDFKNPNYLTLGMSYTLQPAIINASLSVKTSDNFTALFLYPQLELGLKLDFYPTFFVDGGVSFPFYPQTLMSVLTRLPRTDTGEETVAWADAGFYVYQTEFFLSFKYRQYLYGFTAGSPDVYTRLLNWDCAFNVRLMPTFTAIGFSINLGFSYNNVTFPNTVSLEDNYLYAMLSIVYKPIDVLALTFGAGYRFWDFLTTGLSTATTRNNLYLGVQAAFTFG